MIKVSNYKRDENSLAVVAANADELETYRRKKNANRRIRKLAEYSENIDGRISDLENMTNVKLKSIEERLMRIEEILLNLEESISGK